MKKIFTLFAKSFICLLICVGYNQLMAQTTYTWNVATGDFTAAASWTPTRTTPATNDVLVFNGSTQANPIVTNVSTQTIGRLRVINGANVIFSTSVADVGAGTIARSGQTVTGTSSTFLSQLRLYDQLYTGTSTFIGEVATLTSNTSLTTSNAGTIAASTSYGAFPKLIFKHVSTSVPALEVASGASINVNCTGICLTMFVDTGAYAEIIGTMAFSDKCKILAIDANSIKVRNQGKVQVNTNFSGNVFGLVGPPNIALFDSGSVFQQNGGGNPFALGQPASKVTFSPGNNFIFSSTNGGPAFSGRTYANFIYRSSSSYSATGGATATFENLQVDSGQFTLGLTGTLNIKGSIIVNSPGICYMNAASGTPNYIFNGTKLQTISGAGTFSINNSGAANINFTLSNNAFGLRLDRAANLGGARFALDSGALNLNGFNLTIGNSGTNTGLITANLGYLIGTGSLTRWFPTGSTSTNNLDSCLFPFGTSTSKRYAWITSNPSSAGTLTVSHTDAAGFTLFVSPFSDNATNNVTVSVRKNYNWTIATGNGIAATDFAVKVQGSATIGQITTPANIRLTLATAVAPGTAVDGAGTVLLPEANRTNLTTSNINNTFYIGSAALQNPLPVKYISFTGVSINNSSVLNWITASETNNKEFEIERSFDGAKFEMIGKVKGNGNISTTSNYTFIDALNNANKPLTIFYRLKQVDFDGQFNYSKTIQITNDTKFVVELSPNPVNDKLNIVTNANTTQFIEILDINGKVYVSQEINAAASVNGVEINTSFLNRGIYLVKLTNQNEVYTKKIIKE
ncbi:MAG: T9SS type A sorting domain-containing protein [Bacteroidota bacterium]